MPLLMLFQGQQRLLEARVRPTISFWRNTKASYPQHNRNGAEDHTEKAISYCPLSATAVAAKMILAVSVISFISPISSPSMRNEATHHHRQTAFVQ